MRSVQDETHAKHRAENAIIAIQGALIVTHGLKDFAPFDRVLKQLPHQICEGIPS